MSNEKIAIVGSGDEARLAHIAAMLGAGTQIIHLGHHDPDPFGPVVLKDCHKPTVINTIANEQPHNPLLARPIREVWWPYQELDLSDRTLSHYTIDTRDFHWRMGKGFDFSKLHVRKVDKNPQAYVHTTEEVVTLLNRYFEESGGAGKWRHFALTGIFRANYNDWQMKYIRIYRVPGEENQFLVCNGEDFIFNKSDLAAPVDQTHLCKH